MCFEVLKQPTLNIDQFTFLLGGGKFCHLLLSDILWRSQIYPTHSQSNQNLFSTFSLFLIG
jgi:hypothetical protein